MQIVVNVKEGHEKLQYLKEQLTGKQLTTGINRAINRTALNGRTVARAAVKAEYNIPQKNLSGVNVLRSTPRTLTAKIFATSSPIPMDAFSPKFETTAHSITVTRKGSSKARELKRRRKKTNVKRGVSIEVYKGQRSTVPFAFMSIYMAPRVFARGTYAPSFGFNKRKKRITKTGNDLPVKPLISVSVYGAVINKEVISNISTKVQDQYLKNLEHELKYLISKKI